MTAQLGMFDANNSGYVIGIVGSEAAKFDDATKAEAHAIIRQILTQPHVTGVSSGHCHLGGIDIWAEEIGAELGLLPYIFLPAKLNWHEGYKPRNLQIVEASHEVHCITVNRLPLGYKGMRFDGCYHCHTKDHVKSGGCWTALQAQKRGKRAVWHVIGK